ncbi:DUF1835 domain-containing protein [Adhaeribacter swui]|uniref:DUF1835 domain-containing protein n=1 Tax=Adhaeribacter swui TaxID=2086471 RepID=A0A7G7G7U6_9BACT|nr:DUF1835 domain-containing protein [Adhaeribacter swui]QNF33230.1 DUF1835 domain-containing protein [Adhaeribacter swui]
MLHILNGDATATIFKQTDLPGKNILVWREILSEGPIVDHTLPADFWQTRQHYLTQTYQEDAVTYVLKVTAEVKLLETYPQHEEVVLWFEHDLLCQVNLLYLLHWFAQRDLGNTKISLVCIGEHPDLPTFKGLGELSPVQLAALFPKRQVLLPDDLALGHRGWEAYAALTPEDLIKFLKNEDFSHLPLLPAALQAHITRFPSVQNGLNAIEQILLELAANHQLSPTGLMGKFWQQTSLFGIGDAQIVNYLRGFEQTGLLLLSDKIVITDLGSKILRDEADYVQLQPYERWLGGVHLHSASSLWRWDRVQGKIVKI